MGNKTKGNKAKTKGKRDLAKENPEKLRRPAPIQGTLDEKLINVADIRFTQELVWDSFNNNSARAGGLVELIEEILSGRKTPTDLPLIRVAWKQGAYWCVDNRRLFVYKHCQLGNIPVRVSHWKDNKEFKLKWQNGWSARAITGEGRRAGVMQRLGTPFPLSPVAEPSLSDINEFMTPECQAEHDASIAALRMRREREATRLDKADKAAACDEQMSALGRLLAGTPMSQALPGRASEGADLSAEQHGAEAAVCEAGEVAEPAAPKRKKRRKKMEGDENTAGEAGSASAGAASVGAARQKKRRKARGEKSGKEAAVSGEAEADARPLAKAAEAAAPAKVKETSAAGAGENQARLTVALRREDSEDEDYDVEVTIM